MDIFIPSVGGTHDLIKGDEKVICASFKEFFLFREPKSTLIASLWWLIIVTAVLPSMTSNRGEGSSLAR
jgi:hypothetical protein